MLPQPPWRIMRGVVWGGLDWDDMVGLVLEGLVFVILV
jgi:hypothetical protein